MFTEKQSLAQLFSDTYCDFPLFSTTGLHSHLCDAIAPFVYTDINKSSGNPVWGVTRVSVYDIIQHNLYTFAKK
jgi:hypothetical protein